jgi:hypothetical protein
LLACGLRTADVNPMTCAPSSAGMSLLDHFATHASERDIRAALRMGESWECCRDRADARYRHAQAMLRAREESQP